MFWINIYKASVQWAFVIAGFVSMINIPVLMKMVNREAEELGWMNFDGM